jgi:hypothetical protein
MDGPSNSSSPPKKAFPLDPNLFVADEEFAQYISTLRPSAQTKKFEPRAVEDNKMSTANGDDAFRSTNSPLVDLFFELSENFNTTRMEQALTDAWNIDSLATLKIIFNSRSIHLGKASRPVAYNALGWLYENHPQTLLANLTWLVRPVIQKKAPKDNNDRKDGAPNAKTDELTDDFEVIDAVDESEPAVIRTSTATHDIKNGGAHGYWKDLANILALAVNGEFHLGGEPRKILNVEVKGEKPRNRNWSPEQAKGDRKTKKTERFLRATELFNNDPNYRALHLTVARLFATQLQIDTEILKSGKDLNNISLAAKWAPSADEFHDKHTYIVGSVAELMHPREVICPQVDEKDRAQYLIFARIAYRKLTVSPLRKHLKVVERDITAGTFDNIKYERVSSLAMDRHQGTFIKKDEVNFNKYLEKVASGDAKISGAVLLPSVLVSKVLKSGSYDTRGKKVSKVQELAQDKVLEGQWKSLVERIKESGTIQSAIAICDVSGSMQSPRFPDRTTPMDSAIGLSLLLAEVVEGPFGGHFITFSATPKVFNVGGVSDKRSFREKVTHISTSPWGMNTNFVSVFEHLILPVAVENKIKPKDMIKQVFVFSDMEFDAACSETYYYGTPGDAPPSPWSSSFERIKKLYADAGYEMPTLVFWNLAGGNVHGTDPHPKPVTAEEPGTALVSGYSQGQLKMFLDGGKFEDFEEEEDVADEDVRKSQDEEGDEDMVDIRLVKKQKIDPIAVVKRAISHPAYSMLKVID